MDKIISGFFNINEQVGERLVQILYYLSAIYIIWTALKMMWRWITFIDNDWDMALWGLIRTPFIALFALVALRVACEFTIAIFKIRDNTSADAKSIETP